MWDRGGAPTGRERATAYLSAFLDGDDLTHAVAEVHRRRRVVRTVPRTLRTAHTVLREHVRVAPEDRRVHPRDRRRTAAGRSRRDRRPRNSARLRLILSQEDVATGGRRTSWVGVRPARRDLLWPGVTTVWLAVIALAILPADGVARGPAMLLTGPEAGGAVTVEGAEIAAEDGGSVRTGDTALVSLTVAGTDDQPATLQWELRRDGEAIFPSAPLVVPADGDVRLAIPPALLADPGEYLVRVTHDGATLFERDFTVSAG